jgi:ketosteroid isomerase-like protein
MITKLLKVFLILSIWGISFSSFGQKKEEILSIMARQEKLWNNGDIDNFMEDYWKSEDLKFVGKNGVTKGWNATKERYHKSYPDKETMGKLKFEILEIEFHSKKTAWVLGKWNLTRESKGDIGGYFTLIFKKIKGQWVITSDHTS